MSAKTYVSLLSLMTVIFGVAVIVCIFATNPLVIGPIGVTLWFVGALVFLQGLIALVFLMAKKSLFPQMGEHKRVTSSWRQGLLIAGDIIIFLALASLRQLGWRDVILLSGLSVLLEFYFRNRA